MDDSSHPPLERKLIYDNGSLLSPHRLSFGFRAPVRFAGYLALVPRAIGINGVDSLVLFVVIIICLPPSMSHVILVIISEVKWLTKQVDV